MRRETLNGCFLTLASMLPPLAMLRRLSEAAIVHTSIAIVKAARHHRVLAAQTLRVISREPENLRRMTSPPSAHCALRVFATPALRGGARGSTNGLRARTHLAHRRPVRSEAHAPILRAEVEDFDLILEDGLELEEENEEELANDDSNNNNSKNSSSSSSSSGKTHSNEARNEWRAKGAGRRGGREREKRGEGQKRRGGSGKPRRVGRCTSAIAASNGGGGSEVEKEVEAGEGNGEEEKYKVRHTRRCLRREQASGRGRRPARAPAPARWKADTGVGRWRWEREAKALPPSLVFLSAVIGSRHPSANESLRGQERDRGAQTAAAVMRTRAYAAPARSPGNCGRPGARGRREKGIRKDDKKVYGRERSSVRASGAAPYSADERGCVGAGWQGQELARVSPLPNKLSEIHQTIRKRRHWRGARNGGFDSGVAGMSDFSSSVYWVSFFDDPSSGDASRIFTFDISKLAGVLGLIDLVWMGLYALSYRSAELQGMVAVGLVFFGPPIFFEPVTKNGLELGSATQRKSTVRVFGLFNQLKYAHDSVRRGIEPLRGGWLFRTNVLLSLCPYETANKVKTRLHILLLMKPALPRCASEFHFEEADRLKINFFNRRGARFPKGGAGKDPERPGPDSGFQRCFRLARDGIRAKWQHLQLEAGLGLMVSRLFFFSSANFRVEGFIALK
ncbi:hypothetical protein DFH06DRAFT_1139827 [Mycena polygramma]|nr:hypothetical protein DFH06DRAFT_1139827 [Mycena polygramma]